MGQVRRNITSPVTRKARYIHKNWVFYQANLTFQKDTSKNLDAETRFNIDKYLVNMQVYPQKIPEKYY